MSSVSFDVLSHNTLVLPLKDNDSTTCNVSTCAQNLLPQLRKAILQQFHSVATQDKMSGIEALDQSIIRLASMNDMGYRAENLQHMRRYIEVIVSHWYAMKHSEEKDEIKKKLGLAEATRSKSCAIKATYTWRPRHDLLVTNRNGVLGLQTTQHYDSTSNENSLHTVPKQKLSDTGKQLYSEWKAKQTDTDSNACDNEEKCSIDKWLASLTMS